MASERDVSSKERDDVPGWVRLDELPPLGLANRTSLISSSHRFQGPLSSLRLRVRLLEYPPLEKNDEPLAIVLDRIFSWQEKVDEEGDGPQLYSYVDVSVAPRAKKSATVFRPKSASSSSTAREELEEWVDMELDQLTTVKPITADKKITRIISRDKERELKEQRVMLRRVEKREEVEQGQAFVDDLLRQEAVSEQILLDTHLRAKRPNTSLPFSLFPSTSDSKRINGKPELHQESKAKGHRQPSFQHRTGALAVEERRHRKQKSLPSQIMTILVKLPQCNRRVVVCRLKALPTAGVVNIRAPFGFRVVNTATKHVFRLSWELHLPSKRSSSSTGVCWNGKTSIKTRPACSTFGGYNSTASFELVDHSEMRLILMGEILTANGFEGEPLCVHFVLETSPGWTNHSSARGTTHSSYTTLDGIAHFSHHFSVELSFSMDALHHTNLTEASPLLLVAVLSLKPNGRVRYEGYGYVTIPSTPGPHTLRVFTWKPRHRSTVDKMQEIFLDTTPSLQDIKAAYIPENSKRLVRNRLGLSTTPSGQVVIRIHLTHHGPSSIRDQASKLELLEKMSSSTIMKNVQKVIDAFIHARKKTQLLKDTATQGDHYNSAS